MKATKNLRMWLAMTFSALFAFELCVNANSALAATPEEFEASALREAQKRIPKILKNPKSAEFDEESLSSNPLIGWGDGKRVWRRVQGVVRGTNSFGGVVPSNWSAYVAESEGELTVAAILHDGEFVWRGELGDVVADEFDRMLEEQRQERERERLEREKQLDAERAVNREKNRVQEIRNNGRRAGREMADRMGAAKLRLTDKESASRAKKIAKQGKLSEDDTKLFVEGFVDGVRDAKNASKR